MTTINNEAYRALETNYMDGVQKVIQRVEQTQMEAIDRAAELCFQTIHKDGLVHLFGSGHSRMAVEEMYPRYGSFPGFHPMVELSLTNHHAVVGSNGQRQAMFLENVEGFGRVIADNFHYGAHDSIILFSHSGAGSVVIDIALAMKERQIPIVAVTSVGHSQLSKSKHSTGYRLFELADIVIDNGAVPGDAMVKIEGLHTPVGPGSTIGNTIIVNLIKCKVAQKLTDAGKPPKVITSAIFVGDEASKELFNASYDEYWRTTRSI
ncbi:SIS domain-containing protein [Paenibacillus qinlingensis]|uniref:Phosphosugar-binding protein n=1 Tax=Paenibacillus qinlingensis TaxID=1837343 RepID=A0ABU1NVN5_9BACL|nr:SIS domain-containing protein [Paenibacillus qinlingensis]MDR6551057.1 putative phosphosugar-binding protein [Paenibacillus qinlingensis]